jgi:hypothetical protein
MKELGLVHETHFFSLCRNYLDLTRLMRIGDVRCGRRLNFSRAVPSDRVCSQFASKQQNMRFRPVTRFRQAFHDETQAAKVWALLTCGWHSVPILGIAVLPGVATLLLKATDPWGREQQPRCAGLRACGTRRQ